MNEDKKSLRSDARSPKKRKSFPFLYIIYLLVVVFAIFGIYQIFVVNLDLLWLFWVYYALTVAFALAYGICSFGTSPKKVSYDLLPAEWTEEEKQSFMATTRKRKRVARYLLAPLLGFVFTFFYDVVALYLPDYIAGIQKVVNGWFT